MSPEPEPLTEVEEVIQPVGMTNTQTFVTQVLRHQSVVTMPKIIFPVRDVSPKIGKTFIIILDTTARTGIYTVIIAI